MLVRNGFLFGAGVGRILADDSLYLFYAFMLLAVPMLHFVKDTEGMQKYPVSIWCLPDFI